MAFKKDGMDDFWDISKLVPKKKPSAIPFSTKVKTVDYTVSGIDTPSNENNKLTVLSSSTEKSTKT